MRGITYYLAKQLMVDKEIDGSKLEIYQYGFFLLIEQLIGLGIPAILCLAAGWGKEYLLFLAVFMTVRTVSGGFHMKTYIRCFIGSFLFILGLMLSIEFFPEVSDTAMWLICMVGMFVVERIQENTPVIHKNRPLKQSEIEKCKKIVKYIRNIVWILLPGLMLTGNYKAIQIIVETLTANFIFMMLGKREYEKEVFA
ncbi:MAG: accessory gene regulator B family protein [Bacillota bacterium]|nr:accessory gene regulator B family protein [Bacillota bacterium]